MTFEKKFSTLKTKFNKADVKKLPENFAIQFTMTDEDCGGTFYIANIDGTFSVEPYDYVDNNAAVTGASADIAKISAGTVADSLEIFPDSAIVFEVAKAYKSEKKPAAKKTTKTAAKKPAAKKPAAKAVKKTAEKVEKATAKVVAKTAEKAVKTEAKAAKAPAKTEAKAPAKTADKKSAK